MTQILILYFQQINTLAIKNIKNLNKFMWSYKIEKGQLIQTVDSNH